MGKEYTRMSLDNLIELRATCGDGNQMIFKLKNTKAEIVECREMGSRSLDNGITLPYCLLKEYPRKIKIEAELPVIEIIVKQTFWQKLLTRFKRR